MSRTNEFEGVVVLFDLDNTVYDLLGGLEREYPSYSRHNQTSYSFTGIKGLDSDEVYALFNQQSFFEKLRVYPEVVSTINELYDRGVDVRFYSSCENRGVFATKRSRLERDFSFEINLVRLEDIDIQDLEFDIVVDDYREKVEGILNKHTDSQAVITEQPYNGGLDHDRVTYANPLGVSYKQELLTLVKQVSKIKRERDNMVKVDGINSFKAIVSPKGETTLPSEVRDYLKLKENDQIVYDIRRQGITIRNSNPEDQYSALQTLLRLQDNYNRVVVQSQYLGVGRTTLLAKLIIERFNQDKVLYVGSYESYQDFFGKILQTEGYQVYVDKSPSEERYEDYIKDLGVVIDKEGYKAVIFSDGVLRSEEALREFRLIETKLHLPVYTELLGGGFKFRSKTLDIALETKPDSVEDYNNAVKVVEVKPNTNQEIRLL